MPIKTVKTFKYVTRYLFVANLTSCAYSSFYANYCNVVNYTSGSLHAPMFWDQYAVGLYSDASVLSSRITVSPIASDSSTSFTGKSVVMVLECSDGSVDSTTLGDLTLERPGTVYTICTQSSGRKITKSWSCKTLGRITDNTFTPAVGAGTPPFSPRFFRLSAMTADGTVMNVADCPTCIIEIHYKVRFSNRLLQQQS